MGCCHLRWLPITLVQGLRGDSLSTPERSRVSVNKLDILDKLFVGCHLHFLALCGWLWLLRSDL